MMRFSKIIQCVALSSLLLAAGTEKASAFLPIPPVPGEPVVDPVNIPNKFLSQGFTAYNDVRTLYTQIKSGDLSAIKGIGGDLFKDAKEIKKSALPGVKSFSGFNANGISVGEGSTEEKEYQDMYHVLFFSYPQEGSVDDASYEVLKTAYRHKKKEYQQDIIVDTYLKARFAEDYLTVVDAALLRLEKCVKGEKTGNECIFFGMQVVEPSQPNDEDASRPAPAEGEDGNTGQIGAVMNSYIVATVYDRLMRIVENLTATEAIFRAAQQIDAASPVSESNESSAAEYLDNGMRFAYSSYQDTAHAATAITNSYKRSARCGSGKAEGNCPAVNEDTTELKSVDNAKILQDLQELDNQVTEAREIHNMKSRLDEYKTMYRQYLTLKKIHDKALQTLQASDHCVVNFLNRHLPENKGGAEKWYSAGARDNKYAERRGLSGWLINQYNEKSAQITIGTGPDNCKGGSYYEECPVNYTKIEESECQDAGGTKYYKCKEDIKTVTTDADAAIKTTEINTEEMSDTDGFVDGAEGEKIYNENRKEAELTWNLGRGGTMKFMEDGGKFKLWNDQKVFQAEYLRNKYRNMRLIIETADQGLLSYIIGRQRAGSDETENAVASLITHIAHCKSMDDAVNTAREEECAGYSADLCSVEPHAEKIVITKYIYKNGKKELLPGYPVIKSQKVSTNDSCAYPAASSSQNIEEKMNNICFTPSCWVKNFYPKVFGENAEHIVNNPDRIVAADKLAGVIETRKTQEAMLNQWIRKAGNEIENLKKQLTGQKQALKDINEKIDTARQKKNDYKKAGDESKQRVAAIDDEVALLKSRMSGFKNSSPDKVALEYKIEKLSQERDCLNNDKGCLEYKKEGINGSYICSGYAKAEKNSAFLKKHENFRTNTVVNEICSAKDENGVQECYVRSGEGEKKSGACYMRLADAQKGFDEAAAQVRAHESRLDAYKDDIIKKLEDEIDTKTNEFAKEYLKRADGMQNAIEKSNNDFENFLEDRNGNAQSIRMLSGKYEECYEPLPLDLGCKPHGKGPGRLESENTACTLTNVLHNNNGNCNGNALKNTIKTELNDKFINGLDITSVLKDIGVPEAFYVDNSFTELLSAGKVDLSTLVMKIQEKLKDDAANTLKTIMTDSDAAAAREVQKALDKIKIHTNQYNLSGNNSNVQPSNEIYDPEQYEEIRAQHLKLLEKMRRPSEPAFISAEITDLSPLFGIPPLETLEIDGQVVKGLKDMSDVKIVQSQNGEEIFYDSTYFVGLPARGNNYRGKDGNKDDNAGRDFMPPMSPMAGLPPLREVFYFSAADYGEIPQENGKPAMSHLLGCKYAAADGSCEQEYLPEIWLHLLARPNLRDDGRYQQTFVERSFAKENINDLVQNQIANMIISGAKPEHYRTVIGRSGIYPCKSGSVIIDVDGGDGVSDMKFMRRNTPPAGIRVEDLPKCQEVSASVGNICNTSSGKICHQLADHGKDGVSDWQALDKVSAKPMYENYSELGQLLTVDMKYRPLQQKILEYLSDSKDAKNVKNDITRQKAERASFKRNIMGSFLDSVIAEDKANKALMKNEKDMRERFETLCTELEKRDLSVINAETPEDCAVALMDDEKFASVKDEDIKCNGNSESFYEQIFCKLNTEKDKQLNGIQAKKNELKKPVSDNKDKPIVQKQWEDINKTIDSLELDKDEYVIIQPEQVVTTETINTAKADKETVRGRMEEGLKSMENQTQAAAYCPIY